jgi:hypothetical protein
MIQFSGGTIVDTTFVASGTRRDLIDQWETAVVAAGWTAISGAGTADKTYETAATPAGFKIRVEAIDPGSGNCAQFKLRDNAALVTSALFLLPTASQLYRIWANKYQFFFFRSGTDMTLQRAFLGAGTLHLPDFMVDWMSGFPYQGWMHGVGGTDVDTTTLANTWRKAPCTGAGSSLVTNSHIWRNSQAGSFRPIFFPVAHTTATGGGSQLSADQWDDGTWWMAEPLMATYQGTASANITVFKGQLWDAVITGKPYDSETVRIIGGLKWRVLTHQAGPAVAIGSTCGTILLKTN